MSRFDTVRRGVCLALAVCCLLIVPELASAKFTGGATVSQVVGTASLAPLTGVKGTYRCSTSIPTESLSVTVTSLGSAPQPSGVRFSYTLTSDRSDGFQRTGDVPLPFTFSARQFWDITATEWTVEIRAVLGNWTGPAWTRQITCSAGAQKEGTL